MGGFCLRLSEWGLWRDCVPSPGFDGCIRHRGRGRLLALHCGDICSYRVASNVVGPCDLISLLSTYDLVSLYTGRDSEDSRQPRVIRRLQCAARNTESWFEQRFGDSRSHYGHYGQCTSSWTCSYTLRIKQSVADRIVRTSFRSVPTRMQIMRLTPV